VTKLLFIKGSPREASRSVALARAYLGGFREVRPDLVVEEIDLWAEPLPAFDGDRANAKLAVITGEAHSDSQRTAWEEIVGIAARFSAADHYLFAVPMWNGGIRYRLKQYIDIIHQPGLLFGLDPKTGYFGLLKNKRATLAYTSGAFAPSFPSPAFGLDHQSTYMRAWLNQAGVTEIEELRHQPTLLAQDSAGDFARAKDEAAARGRNSAAVMAEADLAQGEMFVAAKATST
jgi:FMN-dependent NADH-azoreductase